MKHEPETLLAMARNREVAARTLERLAGLNGAPRGELAAGAELFRRHAAAYLAEASASQPQQTRLQ